MISSPQVHTIERETFILTSSPSMDILISSNLERLIYRITGGNPEECAKLMENLSKGGEYTITPEMKAQLKDFYGTTVPKKRRRKLSAKYIRQVIM